MRAIELQLKGINSFRQEQKIDFSELISMGLFGIFGPTGSGKSTILDAITLALYAKLPRTTKNFINTNESYAFVSFRFQITGTKTREYIVERRFKYNKGTQSVRNTSGKLMEVEGDTMTIHADRPTEVTKKCTEILGLSADDFMRTVVLPQGQFSDFLKLKNTDRRNMLQRIFHLEEYGINLTTHINAAKQEQELILRELQGNLLSYSEVSEEKITTLEEEKNEKEKELLSFHRQKENVQKEYEQAKELYALQEELLPLLSRQEALKEQQEQMEDKKRLLELSERAERLLPFWEHLQEAERDLREAQKEYSGEKTLEVYDEILKEQEEELEQLRVDDALQSILESGVEKEKLFLKRKLQLLEKQQESEQTEELARRIRTHLQEGEACPVCGSKYHVWDVKEQELAEDDSLEAERICLKQIEAELQELYKQYRIENFEEALKEYRQQEKKYNQLYKCYLIEKQKRQEAELALKMIEQKQENREKAQKFYEEQAMAAGFSKEEVIKDYILSQKEQESYLGEQKEYEREKIALEQKIGYLRAKQEEKVISEEEWNEIKTCYEKIQDEVEETSKEVTLLTHEIEETCMRLKEKGKLEQVLEKEEEKRSRIKELEQLFRGNSFIEYIAQSRLAYIAKEASDLLKTITNGKYSLEINKEAEFMIRDYNNGGMLRPCDTLSGGETFVTSLALALALSSSVQLSGNAPLEFFFLDEGFGSLDEELLDVVMTSLENLQNKNRSIGIISHVESIRNRVPRKIIVTPSEEGSKVGVEYS